MSNLNFSQSHLDLVSGILNNKTETYDIPVALVESAKKAAIAIKTCNNVRDKSKILKEHFNATVTENKLSVDAYVITQFEKCVTDNLSK